MRPTTTGVRGSGWGVGCSPYSMNIGPDGSSSRLRVRRAIEVLSASSRRSASARIGDSGKHSGDGDPDGAQARITVTLIALSGRHDVVVRLKGGDPFVFGRGAEELDALHAARIAVQVVPGLTSALAVPALARVAVTERGVAGSVTIASGHDVDAAVRAVLAAPLDGTCVLLMAVATRAAIAERLIAAGRPAATPVAVVERGATPEERPFATTLGALGDVEVGAPAVLVVGVVATRLVVAVPSFPDAPSMVGAGVSS